MRCKKHLSDISSNQGLCATCLREKLLPILAVQSGDHSPPLIFPRSPSPPHATKSNDHNRLFHSTPQLSPLNLNTNPIKKEKSRFSLFGSNCTATSSPLPSWLSELFTGKEKKEESRIRGRGMSPESVSDSGGDGVGPGNHSPEKSPVTVGQRGGRGRGLGSRDVAGFAFCISPLVWVRPKQRNVKSKSMPKEATVDQVKPQLAGAASFCKNRSRKIADFGRYHRHH